MVSFPGSVIRWSRSIFIILNFKAHGLGSFSYHFYQTNSVIFQGLTQVSHIKGLPAHKHSAIIILLTLSYVYYSLLKTESKSVEFTEISHKALSVHCRVHCSNHLWLSAEQETWMKCLLGTPKVESWSTKQRGNSHGAKNCLSSNKADSSHQIPSSDKR